VLHPSFAQAAFARVQKDQIAAIQREKSNPQAMATRVLPAILYGKGHAYARPAGGTEEAVARMTREDAARYHATWFKPNNATLLVVGDTTLEELTPLLEKAFAGWMAGPVPAKSLGDVAPPTRPVVYLIDRPGSQQSVISVAQLAPPASSPEEVPFQMLGAVFGSSFSSRLNMNLREAKHWSYGVRTDVVPARGQRAYVTRAPVQADKTREALQELAREYTDLTGARPITADELKDAQLRESLSLPGAFETSSQLSDAYSTILQYRLPESYYDNFTAKAMAVTPAVANALAHRLVVPGQLTWVVVGDMAKVEAEVRRIDADGRLLP
jgi:zinc protease